MFVLNGNIVCLGFFIQLRHVILGSYINKRSVPSKKGVFDCVTNEVDSEKIVSCLGLANKI